MHFLDFGLPTVDYLLHSVLELGDFTIVEWLVFLDLILESGTLLKHLLLRRELSQVAIFDHVVFQLCKGHAHPAALARALKHCDFTLDDGCSAHQLVARTKLRQFVILGLAPETLMGVRRLVGTLVAGDSLADETLAGVN